ncbi:MAG: MFS transporter, partial [SAR324 cluster bacterium]|nr:MFS transporter [SAR324 cluster bacterium]
VLTAVLIAFLDRSNIQLFSGFFVCGFDVSFAQIHLPPSIIDEGLDSTLDAWSLRFISLFNIACSFLSRWSEKFYRNRTCL